MDEQAEQIISLEVSEDTLTLFSTNSMYSYVPALFLCEVYQKLDDHFSKGIPCNEFFNYKDPRGAWVLLSDFFDKTDYLQRATLTEFENYRSRYDIALDYKKGESSMVYECSKTAADVAALKRFERELDPWRKFDKEAVDSCDFRDDIFKYYSCKKMIDFVFCLVHYCVFNGYKIVKCAHCGKLFATKNRKEKYCNRSSPLPDYNEYTCKEAVKAMKDALEKRRKSEYERLRQKANEYGRQSKHQETFNDFCRTYQDHKLKLKKGASVELLLNYKSFLYDSAGTRPKYDRLKDW